MSNIFLFQGSDNYSAYQKLKIWRARFEEKYGADSIESYQGKELKPAEFLTNIETLPFFSEKKLTIIHNFLRDAKEDPRNTIAENLNEIPEFALLVFFEDGPADKRTKLYKKLKKIGTVETFDQLDPVQIQQWLSKKLPISSPLAHHMIQYCGTDMWKLDREIEKLKTYSQSDPITKETIEQLCTPSLSASIFNLTDNIASQNSKNSIRTFRTLNDSGEDPIRTFFMIVRHFRILIQVKSISEKPQKEIASILKLHPFVIKKSIQQCNNFTLPTLKKIYENLLTIDKNFKSGIIKSFGTNNNEYQLAIEKLIINCCSNKPMLKS